MDNRLRVLVRLDLEAAAEDVLGRQLVRFWNLIALVVWSFFLVEFLLVVLLPCPLQLATS